MSYKTMTREMWYLFLDVQLPISVLIVQRVIVGFNIFVKDIISWGNCSQMEVVPDNKTDL